MARLNQLIDGCMRAGDEGRASVDDDDTVEGQAGALRGRERSGKA